MKILGIHDGHNASACLLVDGEIKYAIQEERLKRVKNISGPPAASVQFILQEMGLQPDDIDHVALSSHYMQPPITDKAAWLERFGQENVESLATRLKRIVTNQPSYIAMRVRQRLEERRAFLVEMGIPAEKIKAYDHHLSHAAAAYYSLAKVREKPYLVLTLDGGGGGLCATVSIGKSGQLERVAESDVEDSLGNIYSRVTYLTGFVPWEHEYKLMGMAPYVPEQLAENHAEIFKQYLDLDPDNPMVFKRNIPEPTGAILGRLKEDLFRVRFDWICAGLQLFAEDLMTRWVRACIEQTGVSDVLCAGGVFMNVKANQKILELPEVESLAIMPSAGDESNAIGVAYLGYVEQTSAQGEPRIPGQLGPLYLGNAITDTEAEAAIEKMRADFKTPITVEHYDNIEKKVAELMAAGHPVARAKGRMEFGARAMGNRSIVAPPGSREVIRIINEMIKSRDFWMPFAPSLMAERAEDYYRKPKPHNAPYMIITFDSHPDKLHKFIAASHPYDGTARPQEVFQEWNPEYWQLIKHFEELTGEGIILNTSFNIHGSPIVSSAEDAIGVLLDSGLRYLALGNYLLSKSDE